MKPIIEFDNVTLGYGRTIVLSSISFSIHEGEFFGLVGPNGAGKTTLLRAILGTLQPHSGTVHVGSGEKRLCIGYVPQRDTVDNVMPHSVEEVVMMGRFKQIGLMRRPKQADRDVVFESLRHIGIEDLATVTFKDLSGGQKQRTLIARALASEPSVLILDEPTNGMDLPSRTSILDLIRHLHENDKLTVLMVSHMLDDVANYVKRIALVERASFQVGDVDDVLTEENLSALYELPVTVSKANGGKIILAGGRHGRR